MKIELLKKYLNSHEFEIKLSQRIERLQRAESNPVDRFSVYEDIKEDFIAFLNLFGMVYEPRYPESPDIPFFAWDYQTEIAYRILSSETSGSDLLIEKTRDMGITWLVLWYILWRWLFQEKWYCLIGSRKEEEIDNKAPSSLYGKLRYSLYSLPSWLRPFSFKKSEHDLFRKLINPNRQSYIEGESANPFFGRGKRCNMVFMDELFFWKFSKESWRSSSDSSSCRIAVSTAKAATFPRQLRESMKEQGKLMSISWERHPFKDKEWFAKEEERRGIDPLAVDAELGIKYTADPTYAYYPEVSRCPLEPIAYNPSLPLTVGVDFGVQDKTAIVYVQRDLNKIYVLDALERKNRPLKWYYPFLKPGICFRNSDTETLTNRFTREIFTLKKQEYTQDELEIIERFNAWRPPAMYCGEVAHLARMAKTNTSISQELAGIGIYLRINHSASSHEVRRAAVKKILPITVFSNIFNAIDLYDALENAHYPLRESGNESNKNKPVHDETADFRAAFENIATNIEVHAKGIREIPYHPRFRKAVF